MVKKFEYYSNFYTIWYTSIILVFPYQTLYSMFIRFDTIHERDRRTDGRTDTA